MTREEAKDILHRMSEDNFYGNHVQEACKVAIKALSPRPGSQEDIIYQAVQEVCHTDNPHRFAEHNQTVFEVAKKVSELSKPSLPSDLDEAAKDYQERIYDGEYSGHIKGYQAAFKAGAEWMAGQGAAYETTISAHNGQPVLLMHDVFNFDLDYGDKVIVQIRKKH